MAEGALDAAQLDNHVVSWLRDSRRFARVLVGQRADGDLRELRLDVRRDLVDEPQHQTGGTAFFLLDGRTVFALAVAVPVVLRDGRDGSRRIVPQPLLQVLTSSAHFLVGQAKLGVVMLAFAVDLAEPLGMVREVRFRRDQREERVYETFIDVLAAVTGLEAMRLAVGLVACGPVTIESVEPEG
jgi:hypothetical protein